MSKLPFDDNRTVKIKGGYEFFCIQLNEMDCDNHRPYQVMMSRYAVPGRYDIYKFDYCHSPCQGVGDRLRYFTDTEASLGDAVAMFKRDIAKKPVIKMIKDTLAIREYRPFVHDALQIIGSIAPKSELVEYLREILNARLRKALNIK